MQRDVQTERKVGRCHTLPRIPGSFWPIVNLFKPKKAYLRTVQRKEVDLCNEAVSGKPPPILWPSLPAEYVTAFSGQKDGLGVRCWTDTQTRTHTHKHSHNPRCACALRVNYNLWALSFTTSYSTSFVSVQCNNGDIRTFTGEKGGPLEVCVSKRWATVCSNRRTNIDAAIHVACRQLGYDDGKRYKDLCILLWMIKSMSHSSLGCEQPYITQA